MSRKSTEDKVSKRHSGQIQVSVSASSRSPQVSSSDNCGKKHSVFSKLFNWNREQPRKTSEYVDKKYDAPFNKVAPELRLIGGLGEIKCVAKHERRPLVNRPTQVQKLCHTTTKLLPNFPLTDELPRVACPRKKNPTMVEASERVKFVENLPASSESAPNVEAKTKKAFDHRNPFSLDLDALSEYQKQKHTAEELEKRKNYQIIRRTMETKALKTVGAEKIEQDIRNEKFGLPEFFNVCKSNEDVKTGDRMRKLSSSYRLI